MGYRFIFVWSGLVCPGLVARSRWPGPGSFRARRPRFCRGPVARSRSRSLPSAVWWPGAPVPVPVPVPAPVPGSRSRSRSRSLPLPGPAGRVPVPIKRITYAGWPASSIPFQEYGGSTLFSKPLVRGKPYCEVGTIIEQKQEPNGCQSQLLDMKTLDVASLAAVFLERLRSRCCLPGVCFLEPF